MWLEISIFTTRTATFPTVGFHFIFLAAHYSYTLYTSVKDFPPEWDTIAAANIFLSRSGLAVLEKAAPANMKCHFLGIFAEDILCGIALIQYINLAGVTTFQDKKKSFSIKEYLFKKFTSNTLFIGNNTLTGQNAYLLTSHISEREALYQMQKALKELEKDYKSKGTKISLLAIKDFNDKEFPDFKAAGFSNFYTFSTQPNMIFVIKKEWDTIEDYLAALTTKYRTQHNRARKKATSITKQKFTVSDIVKYRVRLHELYRTVADRASFNTFYLPENHFEVMKQELGSNFLLYGYFYDDNLVGFSTLIKNGKDIDTYFLGYDERVQRNKMLYLNMLYDMIAYGIKKQYTNIIFARSAMEIKSSIGAVAEPVYGIIKHTNPLINLFMSKLFTYFDPKVAWKPRNPFKTL